MKLSVVVPCYNEQETIPLFLRDVQAIEEEMEEKLTFEYIFVNDGSKDQTLSVLKDISSRFDNVQYLSFSRNFGKEAALLAGLETCTGDLVAVMDADLQDPPELLPQMYDQLLEGYDIVGAYRKNRAGEPLVRAFFASCFYRLINHVSDTEMVDGARDFRLMTRQVVENILRLQEVNRFSKGLFSWVGFRTTYIGFDNRERVAGQTSWSFFSLFKYSLEGFINFSDALLNVATVIGLLSFLFSLLAVCFIVVRRLIWGDPVQGWASLVVIILMFSGIQLLSIGILGKYLSKIFLETKRRPIYIVQESSLNYKENR